jgi:hypothetical protein
MTKEIMTKEQQEVKSILKDALHFHDEEVQALVAKHVNLYDPTYLGDEQPENSDSEFEKAARPLIKYMAEEHHPHVRATVDGNSCQLWESKEGRTINDYVVD